jgi:hypothetical protein
LEEKASPSLPELTSIRKPLLCRVLERQVTGSSIPAKTASRRVFDLIYQCHPQAPNDFTQSECPAPELTMMIDRPDPPPRSGSPLTILFRFETLDLQSHLGFSSVLAAPPDEIIRAVLVPHALPRCRGLVKFSWS